MNKKTLVINPQVSESELPNFLSKLTDIEVIYVDPRKLRGTKFKTMYESDAADMVICKYQYRIR